METLNTMAKIEILRPQELNGRLMVELGDATDLAIEQGGGFGWLSPPPRQVQETYWRGVMLVPERTLILALLDGVVAGSAQLVRPTRQNEAGAASAVLQTFFVAPWARGHGVARRLVQAVEDQARKEGYEVLNLDVRETQAAAITLYESLGFERWGTQPRYAKAGGTWIAGHHYAKVLRAGEAS